VTFTLRNYQQEAVDAGVGFLLGQRKRNGLIVLPTGSGKSLVIAGIAERLDGPVLIFQPSKEILEQNLAKFHAYGYRPSVYSASMNRKAVGEITLATIGSVAGAKNRASKAHLFQDFPYIIVDECDLAGAKEGQYKSFFNELGQVRILGLTATPYRLSSDSNGSIMKFLTRTRPRIFEDLVYYVQTKDLFDEGYLCPLVYKKWKAFDRHAVRLNSTGADFSDKALQLNFLKIGFQDKIVRAVETLMTRDKRKNALVFTRFLPEAEYVARQTGAVVVTAETPKFEREEIGKQFRENRIQVVVNVGVYLVGFDYPELETVVLARPTRSLRVFYQQAGRGVRIHPDKESCWIVDLVGLTEEFGRLEDLKIVDGGNGKWFIENSERQITNIYFGESNNSRCPRCGSADFFWARHIETNNTAPLCRPPKDMAPNITLLKNHLGKTVYQVVGVMDPTAEFVHHASLCERRKETNGFHSR